MPWGGVSNILICHLDLEWTKLAAGRPPGRSAGRAETLWSSCCGPRGEHCLSWGRRSGGLSTVAGSEGNRSFYVVFTLMKWNEPTDSWKLEQVTEIFLKLVVMTIPSLRMWEGLATVPVMRTVIRSSSRRSLMSTWGLDSSSVRRLWSRRDWRWRLLTARISNIDIIWNKSVHIYQIY